MSRPALAPWVRGPVTAGIAALFAACSTLGDDFDMAQARAVKNGMTEEQVIAIMGSNPSAVEGAGHGKLVWLYSSASPLSFHLKRISFSLDERGRVYGIPKDGPIGSVAEEAY
jgi:hypothetical protein